MSRSLILVKDMMGTVQARMVIGKDETPVLEPWMVHNVRHLGWSVEKWETREAGVQIHGLADWQGVAEKMAGVLRQIISEDVGDEESAEQMMEDARAALDAFTLAELEVAVAEPDPIEGDDTGEGGDSGQPART